MFAMASLGPTVVGRPPKDPLQNLELATSEATTATFAQLLQHCIDAKSLSHGKYIHGRLVEQGKQQEPAISSLLVQMYAGCGSVDEARSVFDEIREPSDAAWEALVLAYSQIGRCMDAAQLVRLMDKPPQEPLLLRGKCFHDQVAAEDDISFGNALISMYGKHGSLVDAEAVFEQMSRKNVGSWNAMIAAYASNGQKDRALQLFSELLRQEPDLKPDQLTFESIFGLFSSLDSEAQAMAVHAAAAELGYDKDPAVVKALITMYARCEKPDQARMVFDRTQKKSVDVWNTMISANATYWEPEKAINVYKAMETERIQPDHLTFVSALSACWLVRDLTNGRMIHNKVKLSDMESNVQVARALLTMYSRCGSVEDTKRALNRMQDRGRPEWNALIWAYTHAARCEEAFDLLKEMEVAPDQETFYIILHACGHYGLLNEGWFYFRTMQQLGVRPGEEHFGCIIAMLMKVGRLKEAEKVIDTLPVEPGVGIWRALLGW